MIFPGANSKSMKESECTLRERVTRTHAREERGKKRGKTFPPLSLNYAHVP
jgi:hypothetical protein